MDYTTKPPPITPRIIIHGGAGNITRSNLPTSSYTAYRNALLSILEKANTALQQPGALALDIATQAVSLLELNPLFNASHGAVYTTAGTHELEASIMTSTGYKKRGVGVMGLKTVKHPIQLAREMLLRGEEEDGGGAHGHSQLHGETCERLAREWGVDTVRPSWFWTRKRWEEHRRGLGLGCGDEEYERGKREADCGYEEMEESVNEDLVTGEEGMMVGDIGWDGKEYLPQGTVGAVVLDSFGTLCVATSTGGMTNKLPGRIGDTPTLGAGFWAEEWFEEQDGVPEISSASPLSQLFSAIGECMPNMSDHTPLTSSSMLAYDEKPRSGGVRAVAMSGTGNGDSFLRTNAVRTAAAITRYSSNATGSGSRRVSLQQAVTAVAGPHGQLQHSAGDRWRKTGEGEGGIIGIELVNDQGKIVYDFNCGGMFHAWIDEDGKGRFELFQDGPRPPLYS